MQCRALQAVEEGLRDLVAALVNDGDESNENAARLFALTTWVEMRRNGPQVVEQLYTRLRLPKVTLRVTQREGESEEAHRARLVQAHGVVMFIAGLLSKIVNGARLDTADLDELVQKCVASDSFEIVD